MACILTLEYIDPLSYSLGQNGNRPFGYTRRKYFLRPAKAEGATEPIEPNVMPLNANVPSHRVTTECIDKKDCQRNISEFPPEVRVGGVEDSARLTRENTGMPQTSDINQDDEYLDSCQILLLGLSSADIARAISYICSGGGTRVHEYRNTVTHIVSRSMDAITDHMRLQQRFIQATNAISFAPPPTFNLTGSFALAIPCLRLEWLEDCFSQKRYLSPDAYSLANLFSEPMHSSKRTRPPEVNFTSFIEGLNTERELKANSDKHSSNLPNEDIMSGISMSLHGSNSSNAESKPLIPVISRLPSLSERLAKKQEDKQVGIFSNMHFGVVQFGFGDRVNFKKQIKLLGGIVFENLTESSKLINVIICLTRLPTLCVMSSNGTFLANKKWLEACVKDNILHHPHSSLLYSPIPPADKLQPIFRGFIISQSVFKNEERALVGHLIEKLGAKLTDGFSRTNTHLICKQPSGEKFQRAVTFATPVLSFQWVLDSATHGQVQPFDPYLLSPTASVNLEWPQLPLAAPQIFACRHVSNMGYVSSSDMNLDGVDQNSNLEAEFSRNPSYKEKNLAVATPVGVDAPIGSHVLPNFLSSGIELPSVHVSVPVQNMGAGLSMKDDALSEKMDLKELGNIFTSNLRNAVTKASIISIPSNSPSIISTSKYNATSTDSSNSTDNIPPAEQVSTTSFDQGSTVSSRPFVELLSSVKSMGLPSKRSRPQGNRNLNVAPIKRKSRSALHQEDKKLFAASQISETVATNRTRHKKSKTADRADAGSESSSDESCVVHYNTSNNRDLLQSFNANTAGNNKLDQNVAKENLVPHIQADSRDTLKHGASCDPYDEAQEIEQDIAERCERVRVSNQTDYYLMESRSGYDLESCCLLAKNILCA
jgi:hypothetical protein